MNICVSHIHSIFSVETGQFKCFTTKVTASPNAHQKPSTACQLLTKNASPMLTKITNLHTSYNLQDIPVFWALNYISGIATYRNTVYIQTFETCVHCVFIGHKLSNSKCLVQLPFRECAYISTLLRECLRTKACLFHTTWTGPISNHLKNLFICKFKRCFENMEIGLVVNLYWLCLT